MPYLLTIVGLPFAMVLVYLLAYFAGRGWTRGKLHTIEAYWKARTGQTPPSKEIDS